MLAGILNRAVAPVALAAAAIVLAVVLLSGDGETQRLRIRLENASQLVKGNEVKVGGLAVGVVKDITLTDDNGAEVDLEVSDEKLLPLHQGTRAWVRASSLSGVANRYVALEPGANDAPALKDDAVIQAQDTRPAVDLDAVLSTLDADTRAHLQRLSRGGAAVYAGRSQALNRGLAMLNPAVGQLEATLRELNRDRGAFERFIVASAGWVSAVAERSADLEQGLAATATTARAIADESAALSSLLQRAPSALRQSSGTLQRTADTLRAIEPAVREARPVAPRVSRLLRDLDPVLDRLAPAAKDTRPLLRYLRRYLAGAPATRKLAEPAFAAATQSIDGTLPIVRGLLPYLPDVVLGATNGFGGTAAGPYDANGEIGRIGFMAGSFSFSGVSAQLTGGANPTAYKPYNTRRCPGAATQVAPDGSNRLAQTIVPCDEGQRP